MTYKFDKDPLGCVLEYASLMGGNPVVPNAAQSAWQSENLRAPSHQTWTGPAMFQAGLVSLLSSGRDLHAVRPVVGRAMRIAEAHGLLEPLRTDDNPHTTYREITQLGRELIATNSHLEYVNGARYIVQKWRSSVVKIFHPSEAGIGTGFLIAPNLVATARHVLDGLGEFVVELEDGTQPAHAPPYFPEDPVIDLALIQLDKPVGVAPLRLSTDYDLLDEVVVLGYPPVPFASDAFLVVNRGEVSSDITLRTGAQAMIISCLLRGGNSGGPVVNRRGEVIGVVSENLFNGVTKDERSINEGIGFAAAVPVISLEDLIISLDI